MNLIDSFGRQDFSKAALMIIAMVVPVTIGVYFEALQMGIFVSLGVFYVSPNDTSGSLRLKVSGMVLAIILTLVVTLVLHFLKIPYWGLIPILGVIIFGIAYLSVYGFRASLISFSGLLAIVLSFSSLSDSELSIYTRLMLIGIGGLWYILLVLTRYIIFPKSTTEYYLAETLKLTADYIKVRAKLIDKKNDRLRLIKDLLDLQKQITDNHETIRELLISRRRGSGKSSYHVRQLLIFQQLVDMLELAMANPVNYAKTDAIFEGSPKQLRDFQNVLLFMHDRMQYIAEYFSKSYKIRDNKVINATMRELKHGLEQRSQGTQNKDEEIVLKNYWKYLQNQVHKIHKIVRLLKSQSRFDVSYLNTEDSRGFLTKQNYNLGVLIDNFNIQSTIFRHSLRLAVVSMIGYGLGIFLNVDNAYWVLLTVIVIMRPNYGLTKTRFKHRSIGTLIGGVSAFVLVFFIHETTVHAILAIVCFVVGFSMIQRNYKAAAAFITMYVVFIYALLEPDVFSVIQFRVLDTLIGAALAFGANLLLWPAWEIKSIDKTLTNAIYADRDFLNEIATYYTTKDGQLTPYKLSRKNAFLKLSDLTAGFQRMAQEPKAQHKSLNGVFQMVMLMHSFLASLASLGTYIIHNPTTPATDNFKFIIKRIADNLSLAAEILEDKAATTPKKELFEPDKESFFEVVNKNDLKSIAKIEEFQLSEESNTKEEAHLVSEQLKWLLSNSHRMSGILQKIDFK